MNVEAGGGSTPSTPEPGSPGELLRTQRERRGLSIQQAAEDLHLDTVVIEAIESDRFQALGAPVYAKGHLRRYAMLLGLSPQLVLQRYEALSDTPVVPTPIPAAVATPPPRERRSLKVPLAIIAGVVLIALAWWLFEWLTKPSAPPIETEIAPEGVIGSSEPAVAAQIEPTVIAPAAENVAAASEAAPVGPPAVASANVEAPSNVQAAAGDIQLTLEFSEPSWTEIYDAAGNRLMFETGAPGRARSVNGTPPLRVTLGFASAVTVRVDGRQIVIPRRAGKDAAKFAIEADGSVR